MRCISATCSLWIDLMTKWRSHDVSRRDPCWLQTICFSWSTGLDFVNEFCKHIVTKRELTRSPANANKLCDVVSTKSQVIMSQPICIQGQKYTSLYCVCNVQIYNYTRHPHSALQSALYSCIGWSTYFKSLVSYHINRSWTLVEFIFWSEKRITPKLTLFLRINKKLILNMNSRYNRC